MKKFNQNKLSEALQLRFLKHLQRNLQVGYSLLEALEMIKWDRPLKPIAHEIIESLKKGETIDRAFEQVNFHYTIVAYLFFAKERGDLVGSLKRCIQTTIQRKTHLENFKKTLRYPYLLFIVFVLVLYVIKHFILPVFMNLIQAEENVDQTLKYLLLLTDTFVPFLLFFLLLLLSLYFAWQYFKKHLTIERQINILQRVPIYRSFLKGQISYQFSTHLSALLQTGMPLNKILDYIVQQKYLPFLSYYARRMLTTLNEGKPLIHLLAQLRLLDERVIDTFQMDRDKKTLGRDLATFAEIQSNELQRKINQILKVIQPILFVFLGVLIIVLYLLLIWPMLQMIQQI